MVGIQATLKFVLVTSSFKKIQPFRIRESPGIFFSRNRGITNATKSSNQSLRHTLDEDRDVGTHLLQSSGVFQDKRPFHDVISGMNIHPLPLVNWYERLIARIQWWIRLSFFVVPLSIARRQYHSCHLFVMRRFSFSSLISSTYLFVLL